MKRLTFLCLLACMSAFCSCEKQPSYGEPSKSTHSFYVENKLSEPIRILISCVCEKDPYNELSPDYQLNFYKKVTIEPNQRLKVRYFDRSLFKNSEALNAFIYDNVLRSTEKHRHNCMLIDEYDRKSQLLLWSNDYWDYFQLNTYTAEYTLVVDQALWDAAFPEK